MESVSGAIVDGQQETLPQDTSSLTSINTSSPRDVGLGSTITPQAEQDETSSTNSVEMASISNSSSQGPSSINSSATSSDSSVELTTGGTSPDSTEDAHSGLKRTADHISTDEISAPSQNLTGNKRIKTSRPKQDCILDHLKIQKDGKVAPYTTEAEGRPRLAIYHPSFKAAEGIINKTSKTFLKVIKELEASGYSNDEINSICKILDMKYSNVKERYPVVAPVACLGPSGVGKSSTINSILHQVGVAYESDAGTRGTNLVHEFAMPTHNQTSMFEVAAPYLRRQQIQTMVEQHFGNILCYLGSKEGYEEAEDLEIDDLENKYETAIEFFHILLRDHKKFSAKDKVVHFFEENMDAEPNDTIETLTELIERFKKSRNLRDGIEYFNAENNKELAEIFRTISRVAPSSAGKPHPWPILTKVEVCHENDLLNAGLIVGDTPGIDDINQGVVDCTKRYIEKAGTVLVFTKFERGAINETLDANLTECIGLGKTHDIRLIVTNVDGRKLKSDERDELDYEDLIELEEAEGILRAIEMDESKIAEERDDARRSKDWDLFEALDDKLSLMPIKKEVAEARVKQVKVEIKCRGFAKEVKDKLRKLDRSRNAPELPIHFVSNSQYQIHLEGYDAKKPPSLDLEGTGILAVRRMLYQVPARGKRSALSRIGTKLLPKLFSSIIGVLTKSRLERKNEVLKDITDTLDEYTTLVSALTQDIRRHFGRKVIEVFNANSRSWAKEADRFVDTWSKYKANTFTAFCRKSGRWKAGGRKDSKWISWNGSIQGIMADDIQEAFQSFDEGLLTIVKDATTDVTELFRKLEIKLEENEAFQVAAGSKDFVKDVQLIRDILLKDLTKIFRALFADMEAVRHLTLIDRDSYVGEIMHTAYEDCKLVTNNSNPTILPNGRRKYQKSTAHPERVEIIRQRIKGSATDFRPSVFEAVCDKMTAAFEEKLVGWEQLKYSKKLKEACDEVMLEFERRFKVETEIKQEGDKEAIEKLKEAAYEAMRTIEGRLKEHIDKFEAYEKSDGMQK